MKRQFDIQHGSGSERIECDSMENKDGRIVFKSGEHVVCDFNAAYVHSVREVKQDKPQHEDDIQDGKSSPQTAEGTKQATNDQKQPIEETKPA